MTDEVSSSMMIGVLVCFAAGMLSTVVVVTSFMFVYFYRFNDDLAMKVANIPNQYISDLADGSARNGPAVAKVIHNGLGSLYSVEMYDKDDNLTMSWDSRTGNEADYDRIIYALYSTYGCKDFMCSVTKGRGMDGGFYKLVMREVAE